MDSEGDLLARAASGSRADFDRLYDAFFPRVYAFAMRGLGEREAAEQVTRQVFLDLIEVLARPGEGPPAAGWIFERTRLLMDRCGRRRIS